MYSFSNRLDKLISFDMMRICKLFEMIQYSFIFLLLIIIFIHSLNKFYFEFFSYEKEVSDEKNNTIFNLFLIVLRDTIVVIIVLFYLRKIALLFPSIPSLIVPSFNPHTTLDISMHIALVFVFLEFIPEYRKKIEELRKKIYNYDKKRI